MRSKFGMLMFPFATVAAMLLGTVPTTLRAQAPDASTAAERAAEASAQPAQAPASADAEPLRPARQLMPSASLLLAPVPVAASAAPEVTQPAALTRRDGFGMMIGGGALFVAGLLVGGDAGTIMALAGGGVGAYGLYLYFR